jgi:chromosome segregation protein
LRLTHIKLAGFKSFVDPTTIALPGQRIGIVGPNGCGKSNVIDAVRWVLGEASARQLRGETMQDVIFNGSSTRKPVGRASVELVFDNSLGKAGGQWSRYAEISVKRVLHRDGESAYFINNLQVRRKDVIDIFLGTGLGARAYAIIEQGTISRIIEARPEELRVFLEEAAGVSKYKDRRRETEQRLKDTRENLLRVEDILQELDGQLSRLEAQAEVAQRYLDLQGRLRLAQNLLCLVRKREAGALRERWQKETQRLANALEAETAALRQAENQLEQVREAHYRASDALHETQGGLYTANAEVARLEQALQHQRENRQRLAAQIGALRDQAARLDRQRKETAAALEAKRGDQERTWQRLEESRARLEREGALLPEAEGHFRACQQRHGDLQRTLAQNEQSRQIEKTHRAHAQKTLQQLQARAARLEQEKGTLPAFDRSALEHVREELAEAAGQWEAARAEVEDVQAKLALAEEARRQAGQAAQFLAEQVTRLDAQLGALRRVQAKLERNDRLHAWLERHGLDRLPRLWQNLSVRDGWDDAVESVLRERLNAVDLENLNQADAWMKDAPPAPFSVFEAEGAEAPDEAAPPGLVPLRGFVAFGGEATGRGGAFLDDWLHRVYGLEDAGQGFYLRHCLPPGGMLVSREGHVFTRHGVSFYAPQSELHGVLARQREIEQLERESERQREALAKARAEAARADEAFARLRDELASRQARVEGWQQKNHRLQLEVQRLGQLEQQVAHRAGQIERELAEIAGQMAHETELIEICDENLAQIGMQAEALEAQRGDAEQALQEAETALNRLRESARQLEHEVREAGFVHRGSEERIAELERLQGELEEQIRDAQERLGGLLEEEQSVGEEPLKEALQQALAVRQERERSLAEARNALEGVAARMRELEQQRLSAEHRLNPLREQLGEARLKEQEARLSQEQFAGQLEAAGAAEPELEPLLEKGRGGAALQAEIGRLGAEIEALGAVNLAAVEELQVGRERRHYLESQAADLNEAIATLEQAIRRIDRETRERLRETFDTANRHLSEIFPALFGGGHAELVLTGEEILDAGVQVIAQPPGKKNSTIHLLSGGEKALTAMSLMFSLFRLNPAPFCLLDEVDAPLDDTNTERFCNLVREMSRHTQFVFISHNKITMEMAEQLIGITMQEQGVSRMVAVDIEQAIRLRDAAA